MADNCKICDGTGWARIQVDRASRVQRCVCRTRAKAEADKKAPGGFTSLQDLMAASPAVRDALTETDRRVASLIERHQGAAAAVTIKEIAGCLWPATSMDLKTAERQVRDVKASVERLRTVAHMPIAASKVKPYGYFLVRTPEEAEDMFERHRREMFAHWEICKLFKPGADLVRELEGQLSLNQKLEVRN